MSWRPDFAAGLDFAARRARAQWKSALKRVTRCAGRARLHVLEEGGEAADDLARVQVFGDAAEGLEIARRPRRRARCPEADADFVEREFALEGERARPTRGRSARRCRR